MSNVDIPQGGFSGNVNDYDLTPRADPAVTANVATRTGQTSAGIAQDYSSGMGEARGLLNQPSQTNNTLSYGDQATSAAIKARYNQDYTRQENDLKVSVMRNADADHIRSLQVATAAAGQEVQENREKAILKYKIEQANRRARGQVLGSVLGIVGTVGGAVAGGAATGTFVGGAVGAQAGGALGSGIGQAYGSNN